MGQRKRSQGSQHVCRTKSETARSYRFNKTDQLQSWNLFLTIVMWLVQRFRVRRNLLSKLDLARLIFKIGIFWQWNWYSKHINLNNVILWGIIQICDMFVKTWHFLLCYGVCFSFWPFAVCICDNAKRGVKPICMRSCRFLQNETLNPWISFLLCGIGNNL